MPRKPRLNIRDGVYHVINRGVDRRNIVGDDTDREQWLRHFARTATRRAWRVFAWTLLDNHFHLFVRTPAGDLSDGMRDFQGSHAAIFNQRHGRSGHLFQGRFKAELVEEDSYAWQVSRYIHLNPVRANLCRQPGQYRWSSFRHYLDPRRAPQWLDWRAMLSQLAGTEAAARLAYKRFVDEGIDTDANPFVDVVDGWLLGSDEFVSKWQSVDEAASQVVPADLELLVRFVGEEFRVVLPGLSALRGHKSAARDVFVYLAREVLAVPGTELARDLEIGKSAVSEAVRRAKERMATDNAFAGRVERVRRRLLD